MTRMATDYRACGSEKTSEAGRRQSKTKKDVFGHSIWRQLLSVAAVAVAHAYAAPWEDAHGNNAPANPKTRG